MIRVFGPNAAVIRDGLLQSCTCHYHRRGRDPGTPNQGTPALLLLRWLLRVFSLLQPVHRQVFSYILGVEKEPSWDQILFTACHNKHMDLGRLQAKYRLDSWGDREKWIQIIELYKKNITWSSSLVWTNLFSVYKRFFFFSTESGT